MRELLVELYIKHGDRPFVFNYTEASELDCYQDGYVKNIRPTKRIPDSDGKLKMASYLTPKALKLIKNG